MVQMSLFAGRGIEMQIEEWTHGHSWGRWGEKHWESRIDMTVQHHETASEVCCVAQELSLVPCDEDLEGWAGARERRRLKMGLCIHITDSFHCMTETHSIVQQLSSNKRNLKKFIALGEPWKDFFWKEVGGTMDGLAYLKGMLCLQKVGEGMKAEWKQ